MSMRKDKMHDFEKKRASMPKRILRTSSGSKKVLDAMEVSIISVKQSERENEGKESAVARSHRSSPTQH